MHTANAKGIRNRVPRFMGSMLDQVDVDKSIGRHLSGFPTSRTRSLLTGLGSGASPSGCRLKRGALTREGNPMEDQKTTVADSSDGPATPRRKQLLSVLHIEAVPESA